MRGVRRSPGARPARRGAPHPPSAAPARSPGSLGRPRGPARGGGRAASTCPAWSPRPSRPPPRPRPGPRRPDVCWAGRAERPPDPRTAVQTSPGRGERPPPRARGWPGRPAAPRAWSADAARQRPLLPAPAIVGGPGRGPSPQPRTARLPRVRVSRGLGRPRPPPAPPRPTRGLSCPRRAVVFTPRRRASPSRASGGPCALGRLCAPSGFLPDLQAGNAELLSPSAVAGGLRAPAPRAALSAAHLRPRPAALLPAPSCPPPAPVTAWLCLPLPSRTRPPRTCLQSTFSPPASAPPLVCRRAPFPHWPPQR